ncbi:DUF3574 domain-containing protein [Streptomyces sp. Wb2n-11]|uniref:DUF3574 domain-containing protein n=1 Tax=Streptomyces sp. Wb2n-11 TaxID=1030533 RepID=UPI000B325297|nr:DUF3574 domain-containing protein [Streptomyces sp. Wb2n-11]
MPFRTASARLAATGAVLLAAGAPAAYAVFGDEAPAAAVRGEAYVQTRLFFGTGRPGGGPDVTDRQFMDFVERQVTRGFPEGLTVQDGRGQWRNADGTIERERSYELILLYPASQARARDPHIERIRDAYERAYAQESVARLDDPVRADF